MREEDFALAALMNVSGAVAADGGGGAAPAGGRGVQQPLCPGWIGGGSQRPRCRPVPGSLRAWVGGWEGAHRRLPRNGERCGDEAGAFP